MSHPGSRFPVVVEMGVCYSVVCVEVCGVEVEVEVEVEVMM